MTDHSAEGWTLSRQLAQMAPFGVRDQGFKRLHGAAPQWDCGRQNFTCLEKVSPVHKTVALVTYCYVTSTPPPPNQQLKTTNICYLTGTQAQLKRAHLMQSLMGLQSSCWPGPWSFPGWGGGQTTCFQVHSGAHWQASEDPLPRSLRWLLAWLGSSSFTSFILESYSRPFFCRGPDGEYLRLCGSYNR